MKSRVIMVTGGSRGLGKKIIENLSSDKLNKLYYSYSRDSSPPHYSEYNNVISVRCDQRDENQVTDCISNIISAEGRIDVLINNACPSFISNDFLYSGWDIFQDLIDVNVGGAYRFTREAAKSMKNQGGGRIINILTSYVLNVPPEKIAHYITAKYALLGLSKALAVELCKYGITVNMISPGLMKTDLTSYLPSKYLDAAAAKNPMKRLTSTDDAVKAIEFLISDNAGFINGVNIPVNGGENF